MQSCGQNYLLYEKSQNIYYVLAKRERMDNMKKLTSIVITLLMIVGSTSLGFANDTNHAFEKLENDGLSKEAVEFLQEHGVDLDIVKDVSKTDMESFASQSQLNKLSISDPGSIDSAIISLKHQTEANDFTDEQVQAYVKGLVDHPTTILGELYGGISPMAANRPGEDGVGYEVKSKDGYYQTTAFAVVPDAYRGNYNDSSAYMFWTLKDKIDIGIWYSDGDGGTGWRVFWMANKKQNSTSPQSGLYEGRDIYFTTWVVDNNWARIKIVDGNNFSKVISDYSIYTGGLGITQTNNNMNRQITLCREGSFTGRAYVDGARFYDAYIYKTNGTFEKTLSTNCVAGRLGSFGTNDTTKNLVKINRNYTEEWFSERVSITFNM